MILSSKHTSPERALFTTGSFIFSLMVEPMTISKLWHLAKLRFNRDFPLYYHDFILSLDVLFLLGYVELNEGMLIRKKDYGGKDD